jgi:thioredoxin-related protein
MYGRNANWRLTIAAAMTAILMAVSVALGAEGSVWMTDLKAAKEKAAKEKKDILIDFSGSDWCGWCIKLDQEVFSQKAFLDEAPKYFVLVVLDFPQKPENKAKITPEQSKVNDETMMKFGVEAFPTVFLTTADGKPYAQTGYEESGPEKYVKSLLALGEKKTQRDDLLAKATKAKGPERIKLLDQALGIIGADVAVSFWGEQAAEIARFDSPSSAGLKLRYGLALRTMEARKAEGAKDWQKAADIRGAAAKELKLTSETLQGVLMKQGEDYFRLKKMDALVTSLKAALEAAPKSEAAPRIQQLIERFSQPVEPKQPAEPKSDATPAAQPEPTPPAK